MKNCASLVLTFYIFVILHRPMLSESMPQRREFVQPVASPPYVLASMDGKENYVQTVRSVFTFLILEPYI